MDSRASAQVILVAVSFGSLVWFALAHFLGIAGGLNTLAASASVAFVANVAAGAGIGYASRVAMAGCAIASWGVGHLGVYLSAPAESAAPSLGDYARAVSHPIALLWLFVGAGIAYRATPQAPADPEA